LASPADSDQGCLSAECPRNLFPARSSQDTLPTTSDAVGGENSAAARPAPSGEQTAPNTQVREPSAAPATHQDYQDRVEGPAHPSNRLVAQLNTTWRVIDDPLQWILQRKKGNPLFSRFPSCIPTGTAKRRRQTWTFAEQTKLNPRGHQRRAFPRDWRIAGLAINRLTTRYALLLSWRCLRGWGD
jgi:hypothetical protein